MSENIRSYTPEEYWQKLLDNLSAGLNVDPASVREYYMSNIVIRSLSMLHAYEPISGKITRLQSTTDGRLQVSAATNIFTINDTHSISLPASGSTTITFASTVTRIDFWSFDNSYNIVRTISGIPNQPSITLPGGGYYSVDATTDGLIITNPSSSVTVTGQIVGWA